MNATERRLRALETAFSIKPLKPVRRIIVDIGETVEGVMEREGIEPNDGPGITLIVRRIVHPRPNGAIEAIELAPG